MCLYPALGFGSGPPAMELGSDLLVLKSCHGDGFQRRKIHGTGDNGGSKSGDGFDGDSECCFEKRYSIVSLVALCEEASKRTFLPERQPSSG